MTSSYGLDKEVGCLVELHEATNVPSERFIIRQKVNELYRQQYESGGTVRTQETVILEPEEVPEFLASYNGEVIMPSKLEGFRNYRSIFSDYPHQSFSPSNDHCMYETHRGHYEQTGRQSDLNAMLQRVTLDNPPLAKTDSDLRQWEPRDVSYPVSLIVTGVLVALGIAGVIPWPLTIVVFVIELALVCWDVV